MSYCNFMKQSVPIGGEKVISTIFGTNSKRMLTKLVINDLLNKGKHFDIKIQQCFGHICMRFCALYPSQLVTETSPLRSQFHIFAIICAKNNMRLGLANLLVLILLAFCRFSIVNAEYMRRFDISKGQESSHFSQCRHHFFK